MKFLITLLLLSPLPSLLAQTGTPLFLAGTWKMEHKETYEHWDLTGENGLRGISYKQSGNGPEITEYLEIAPGAGGIVYQATVPSQNEGRTIPFTLSHTGDTYTFSNPDHDFPQHIEYRVLHPDTLAVRVYAGNRGFAYRLVKQTAPPALLQDSTANPNYNAALAQKLQGDDYGMKQYVLVILKTGGNASTDAAFVQEKFAGHMQNINGMAEAGKLIIAGPLGKNEKQYRGIYIFQNAGTPAEVRNLLDTDPAIKAGLLDAEIYNWYGSAALPEYLPLHDSIWRKKF